MKLNLEFCVFSNVCCFHHVATQIFLCNIFPLWKYTYYPHCQNRVIRHLLGRRRNASSVRLFGITKCLPWSCAEAETKALPYRPKTVKKTGHIMIYESKIVTLVFNGFLVETKRLTKAEQRKEMNKRNKQYNNKRNAACEQRSHSPGILFILTGNLMAPKVSKLCSRCVKNRKLSFKKIISHFLPTAIYDWCNFLEKKDIVWVSTEKNVAIEKLTLKLFFYLWVQISVFRFLQHSLSQHWLRRISRWAHCDCRFREAVLLRRKQFDGNMPIRKM